MKLRCLAAALLLAAQVQAKGQPAFGPHFGVSYVYAILTSLVHDIMEIVESTKVDRGKINFFAQVGLNGIGDDGEPVRSGGSSGMDGPFPVFNVISTLSVVPDDKSPTSAYALTADVVVSMDPDNVPWYFSGYDEYVKTPSNDCHAVKIPGTCFWFSQYIKPDMKPVFGIELNNVPEYMAMASEPVPRLPLASNFKIHYVYAASPKSKKAKRADLESEFDYAVSGFQSAKFMCESPTSHGPSFLSTEEGYYCDMTTKTLYSPCSSLGAMGCYRLTNGTVGIVPRQFNKRGDLRTSSPLKIRPFAAVAPRTNQALTKRADCVRGARKTFLNAGESLAMDDHLAGSGSFRMVVRENDDLIVYDAAKEGANPASIAIWNLGAEAKSGSYFAELKLNGQLCSRASNGTLIECAGTKSPENKAYQLTIDSNGYLYIKNGAQVIWTTNPRTPTVPKDIDGYVLTKTNSFQGLASINPGTLFKSTDGSTKMEYNKVGSLCIYNKLGYNTWCLDSPPGSKGKMWLTLSTRGNLCTMRSNGGPLESQCIGNQGEETSYFAVLHNDGFLRIYNAAEKVVWQRGGGHAFRDRNTLRAGAYRDQDGDLRSDNDLFSIYAHSQGGLVVRANKGNANVWSLGGGVTSGGPFIMKLGDDGNLCVGKKSGGSLKCTDTARSDDKYLLYMENDGRAYIYKPDGKSIWRSSFIV
ncbi:hypothetical protein BGX33_008826 [Mortierella sp. NVP41]|nr:hypothetical protein BGX33_008826 [Mortierella sp. NVP41]